MRPKLNSTSRNLLKNSGEARLGAFHGILTPQQIFINRSWGILVRGHLVRRWADLLFQQAPSCLVPALLVHAFLSWEKEALWGRYYTGVPQRQRRSVEIDLAEVRTAEGKLYLFAAIDRTSKFAVVELVERAEMRAATAFLEALVQRRSLPHPHRAHR